MNTTIWVSKRKDPTGLNEHECHIVHCIINTCIIYSIYLQNPNGQQSRLHANSFSILQRLTKQFTSFKHINISQQASRFNKGSQNKPDRVTWKDFCLEIRWSCFESFPSSCDLQPFHLTTFQNAAPLQILTQAKTTLATMTTLSDYMPSYNEPTYSDTSSSSSSPGDTMAYLTSTPHTYPGFSSPHYLSPSPHYRTSPQYHQDVGNMDQQNQVCGSDDMDDFFCTMTVNNALSWIDKINRFSLRLKYRSSLKRL